MTPFCPLLCPIKWNTSIANKVIAWSLVLLFLKQGGFSVRLTNFQLQGYSPLTPFRDVVIVVMGSFDFIKLASKLF